MTRPKSKKQTRKMFVSCLPGEELELALSEDGKLQEYYVEVLHQKKTRGNIYKGFIHNIDASLQAAFINYGGGRNGFLQVDEVHPEYYLKDLKPQRGNRFPPLHRVLKPGQEVLVQVVKEPTGTKGAFLTTYLSMPGRYFVLTLGREGTGVSRKIEDEAERQRLKKIVDEIELGQGMGVIVRTASAGYTNTDLSRDLQYLKRLWGDVKQKGQTAPSPSMIYEEKELAYRAVRDYLTADVSEIWVDDEATANGIRDFVTLVFPRRGGIVKLHSDPERSLFERFNLSEQIGRIYERKVSLPSGGVLVFDHTEALTAVDINSGKIGGEKNFKDMVLKTNQEAAEEIGQQLRMRDIGGQIVIDFIEMKDQNHVREVEKTLKSALKSDRARTDLGRISRFGLLEMVRQRLGSSAISLSTEPCPACRGTGIRRKIEWQALQAVKDIHRRLLAPHGPDPLEIELPGEIAFYLLNAKRDTLRELEREAKKTLVIRWTKAVEN